LYIAISISSKKAKTMLDIKSNKSKRNFFALIRATLVLTCTFRISSNIVSITKAQIKFDLNATFNTIYAKIE